jgi:hypothetical protein
VWWYTTPPIQWVPGTLSVGVKRPGHESDHSPPSSAEVKNAWSYTSPTQYVFMVWCLVKHNLACSLTEHHAMKAYWENGATAPRILNLGTRWRWVVRFMPLALYLPPSGERAPGIHLIGAWVGPRAGLDAVVKRKIPSCCRDSNPHHPARSSTMHHWAIPAAPAPAQLLQQLVLTTLSLHVM